MVWTLSIQGDIPFAQNNTTINGTWQLLAYLSGPCWSASQLYRLSPIDCNRTRHYFPWSSNDSANPRGVQHRGFSRVPAIYPDPAYFTPSIATRDHLSGLCTCPGHISSIRIMHLYLSISTKFILHFACLFICILVCREVAARFLLVTLKTSSIWL